MKEVISGEERDRYLEVLADWRFTNIVVWERDARRQLEEHLRTHTQLTVGEILYAYALGGGKIVRQDENRDPWNATWQFHYDLFPTIDDIELFVETRFDERKPDWPKILIVNLHPPGSHSWL